VAFEFIEANRASLSVATMCSLLDVSRSGYYGWRSVHLEACHRR
jgi:hypothetical protein